VDRHGAQSGKLTGISRGDARSVERGVFGRSGGSDEGVFAGGLALGE